MTTKDTRRMSEKLQKELSEKNLLVYRDESRTRTEIGRFKFSNRTRHCDVSTSYFPIVPEFVEIQMSVFSSYRSMCEMGILCCKTVFEHRRWKTSRNRETEIECAQNTILGVQQNFSRETKNKKKSITLTPILQKHTHKHKQIHKKWYEENPDQGALTSQQSTTMRRVREDRSCWLRRPSRKTVRTFQSIHLSIISLSYVMSIIHITQITRISLIYSTRKSFSNITKTRTPTLEHRYDSVSSRYTWKGVWNSFLTSRWLEKAIFTSQSGV